MWISSSVPVTSSNNKDKIAERSGVKLDMMHDGPETVMADP